MENTPRRPIPPRPPIKKEADMVADKKIPPKPPINNNAQRVIPSKPVVADKKEETKVEEKKSIPSKPPIVASENKKIPPKPPIQQNGQEKLQDEKKKVEGRNVSQKTEIENSNSQKKVIPTNPHFKRVENLNENNANKIEKKAKKPLDLRIFFIICSIILFGASYLFLFNSTQKVL